MVLNIFLSLVILLSAAACVTDLRGLKIPNIIPGAVTILFLIYMGYQVINGTDIQAFVTNLTAGVIMFALTFVFFALKIFGAGDAKLSTALSFWIGLQGLSVFLLLMTFSGGVLGVIALVVAKRGVPDKWQKGWLKSLAEGRKDIPYALPIFIGFCGHLLT